MTDNAEDFASFFDQWFDRVYNYARHRTGSATRADEIASDVFVRALDSWARFDPSKGERRTWLFSIAFRSVAEHYRGEKRRGWLSLDILREPAERNHGAAAGLEKAEEKEGLAAALASLTDQQRELVSLKFYAGLNNREIAALAGLTESNVGVMLFRAVRKLRENLEEGAHHG